MFGGALDANIAAVGMRYGLCDGETESVTALRTGARFVHAIKTIEEMGERILRDDFPLVVYGEQGVLFLPGEPYERYKRSTTRIFGIENGEWHEMREEGATNFSQSNEVSNRPHE